MSYALDYVRAHGWMDTSFHCYRSLPNPIRWLQGSLARWGSGWGLGPGCQQTWVPGHPAPSFLARTRQR